MSGNNLTRFFSVSGFRPLPWRKWGKVGLVREATDKDIPDTALQKLDSTMESDWVCEVRQLMPVTFTLCHVPRPVCVWGKLDLRKASIQSLCTMTQPSTKSASSIGSQGRICFRILGDTDSLEPKSLYFHFRYAGQHQLPSSSQRTMWPGKPEQRAERERPSSQWPQPKALLGDPWCMKGRRLAGENLDLFR